MKTLIKGCALFLSLGAIAWADSVPLIVPVGGVVYGSKFKSPTSTPTVAIDTTTARLSALSGIRVSTLTFLDGTSFASTNTIGNIGTITGVVAGAGLAGGGASGSVTVRVSSVSLSTQVIGNLQIGNFNSGINADSSHFWRGDGLWVSSSAFATPAPTLTPSAVPFGSLTSSISVDVANLNWDNQNKRLGVGVATPLAPLDLNNAAGVGYIARFASGGTQYGSIANTAGSLFLSAADGKGLLIGANSSSVIAISSNGLVGIGGPTLIEAFNIVGKIRIVGEGAGIIFPDGSVQVTSAPTVATLTGLDNVWTGKNSWTTPFPSTFTYGVVLGSATVNDLTPNLSVIANANKKLTSFDLLGSSPTWTGQHTFNGTGQTVITSTLAVGALSISNVASTILAVNSLGVVVSTNVAAAQTYVSSAVVFGNSTNNGISQDATNLAWNNSTKVLAVSTITASSVTVSGALKVTGNTQVNTPLVVNQTTFGANYSEIDFTNPNGTGGDYGFIKKAWFGSVGPPRSSSPILIGSSSGASLLYIDDSGEIGINGLSNGTTFYVHGNVAIGSGLTGFSNSPAPDDGLYVQGAAIFATSTTWRGNVNISSGLILGTDAGIAGYSLVSGGPNTVPNWSPLAGSGIVSPGTFTWVNSKGISVSTIAASGTVTISSHAVIVSSDSAPALSVTANGGDYGTVNGSSGGSYFGCPLAATQGFCAQFYSHRGAQSNLAGIVNIIADNTADNSVGLYGSQAGDNPQNGIRWDGYDYSCIALIDTKLSTTTAPAGHNGKFQICSHNNQLRGEMRNSLNNSFQSGWVVASSTLTSGGVMMVTTGYENPASTLAVNGNFIVGNGIAGDTTGGSAPVNGMHIQGVSIFDAALQLTPQSLATLKGLTLAANQVVSCSDCVTDFLCVSSATVNALVEVSSRTVSCH